jgi:hypothetical protein
MNWNDPVRERLISQAELSLCAEPLTVGGQTLVPDATKGYVLFTLGHSYPAITAYRTTLHPAVVARCWPSLLHQVLDLGHELKAYDAPQDRGLGSVVAVEYPVTPDGGWTLGSAPSGVTAPALRGAGVLHKQYADAREVLDQPRRWTVSQEISYALGESGFLVLNPAGLGRTAAALCARTTPPEAAALGLGYVPCPEAPPELLACYDPATRMVARPWERSSVLLLKGGFTGTLHFMGVGLVRHGAEREAAVERFLAAHPGDFTALVQTFAQAAAASAAGLAALKDFSEKRLTPGAK